MSLQKFFQIYAYKVDRATGALVGNYGTGVLNYYPSEFELQSFADAVDKLYPDKAQHQTQIEIREVYYIIDAKDVTNDTTRIAGTPTKNA